jgi:hypothetical protein
MTDTATPGTGPVDAPASIDSIVAELEAGGEAPAEALEEVTQELVKDTEEGGDSEKEPGSEDATEPGEEPAQGDPEEGTPEGTTEEDAFAKLVAEKPDLMVKIKVNGETIEVPLSELPNGYSRTEDYKAKTAAVAEERRSTGGRKQASLDTESEGAICEPTGRGDQSLRPVRSRACRSAQHQLGSPEATRPGGLCAGPGRRSRTAECHPADERSMWRRSGRNSAACNSSKCSRSAPSASTRLLMRS